MFVDRFHTMGDYRPKIHFMRRSGASLDSIHSLAGFNFCLLGTL